MKTINLLFAMLLLSISAHAQKEIEFDVSYRPEMKYDEVLTNTLHMKLSYSGPKRIGKFLNADTNSVMKGRRDSSVVHMLTTTGRLDQSRRFPVQTGFSIPTLKILSRQNYRMPLLWDMA